MEKVSIFVFTYSNHQYLLFNEKLYPSRHCVVRCVGLCTR